MLSTSEMMEGGGVTCQRHQVPQNYIFKISFMGTNALPPFCFLLETLFQLYLILTDLGQVNSPIWTSVFFPYNS